MKRLALVSFLVCAVTASAAFGADDPVARAMKLYERRHYAEAAAALRSEVHAVEASRQPSAQLTLGMLYLKNAELHRDLYHESLALHLDYLKKLAATRGKSRSRFADLYLGETLIESGKPEAAFTYLERFIADEGIDPRSKALAKVSLGLSFALRENKQRAEEVWAGLDASDPEIKAALAAAYSRAGYKEKNPLTLADESLTSLKKQAAPSLRHLRDVLVVYADARQAEKALDLLKRADLKSFSYKESVSKTKVINFYDVSLLDDLSTIYLQAGIAGLEKASQDGKLRETANFYLGEAYALAGNIDQAMKANAVFMASATMPQQYRDRARARQAAHQHQKGHPLEAIETWDELSKKQPEDPEVIAEVLSMCARLRTDCPKVAQKAAAAVETGEGKRFSVLNIGLGKYYLAKKDYGKAVSYLEAGRDKGNKNKIESNDPAMLVSLAEAYYRTKKFSEALEIYFEMSRQFPEVRQIQEALQGVYAMEHKSAGDVKIN